MRILIVLFAVTLSTLLIAPAAYADRALHVYGQACPGGYIKSADYGDNDIFFNTTSADNPEYGVGEITSNNSFYVRLNNFDGELWLNLAIQCNNGVWYYPSVWIATPYASENIGWV